MVHFPSFRKTLADLWHSLGGISITDLENKRYLFRFFHQVDLDRVVDGMPWFFNIHLLVFEVLQVGQDPHTLPFHFVTFWVQVHGLPPSLHTKQLGCRLAAFLGEFLLYDPKVPASGVLHFMRVKVRVDVHQSLRRKKWILLRTHSVYARFQYERLSFFCFVCGLLGHSESFCPIRLRLPATNISFGWDLPLRALPRRN